MSHPVALTAPISGAHAVRFYPGFGILGADIPASGDNGGSPVLNDGISADKEYHWRLETPPGSGTLTLFDDLTFTLEGAADGNWPWAYRLFENGADQGTATVYSQVGSPSAAYSAALADAVFSGGAASGASASFTVALSDAAFSGGAISGQYAVFTVATDDALFSGGASVSPSVVFSVTLDAATFSGGASGSIGATSLTPADIAAIAEAVYARFAAENAKLMGLPSAAAILAAAEASPIHADMRKTNGEAIVGNGTEGNKFRSHLVV